MNNRIGFCCILLPVERTNAPQMYTTGSDFKKTTLTWCKKNPEAKTERLLGLYESNLAELGYVLLWCRMSKVKLYRISSDLFPLADHDIGQEAWEIFKNSPRAWKDVRREVEYFLGVGGRLTSHPSQYVSIGSEKPEVRENSIRNLNHHGEVFDLLGLPQSPFAATNIHLNNGSTNDLDRFVERAMDSISKLDKGIRSRLTFENEDRGCWRVENILRHFPGFPIVFDTLHHKINHCPDWVDLDQCIEATLTTWGNCDPLTHHSEGRDSPTDRKHSDYITALPDYSNFIRNVDIEVEAKMKNLAIAPFIK
jgi:UV DNA damage endonuclease